MAKLAFISTGPSTTRMTCAEGEMVRRPVSRTGSWVADGVQPPLSRARTAVTDGSERSELHTADRRLRRDYHERARQRRERLSRDLLKLGIPLLQAATDRSPFAVLQQFYGEARR